MSNNSTRELIEWLRCGIVPEQQWTQGHARKRAKNALIMLKDYGVESSEYREAMLKVCRGGYCKKSGAKETKKAYEFVINELMKGLELRA